MASKWRRNGVEMVLEWGWNGTCRECRWTVDQNGPTSASSVQPIPVPTAWVMIASGKASLRPSTTVIVFLLSMLPPPLGAPPAHPAAL